jgi:DNA-binding Lrp family transcriptional regulator
MRYIKLWDGIASDWRYSKSPLHGWLFIHCLIEAWHADAKEFKRGSFRTSYQKLADQTGLSFSTVKRKLKDLSTGDNPEIILSSNRYGSGYTDITVLNYDKYQSNGSQGTSNGSERTVDGSQRTNNGSQGTINGSQRATKEEEEKKVKEEKKEERDFISSSTDVGSSFEELIEVYPKVNTHKVETVALFNNLNLNEKKKCITFAKQLQQIWKQNGVQDKYQFMKSCHTFVELKMFNGKPEDIFPREISTEIKELNYAHEDLELMKRIEEKKLERLNKRKQYEETIKHQ